MNKSDLVSKIAEEAELTNSKADEAFTALLETITEVLAAKDKLLLVGFGAFEVTNRAARTGRNPKTGEEIKIKATIVPKFKPGQALKDAVAGKKAATKGIKATTKSKKK